MVAVPADLPVADERPSAYYENGIVVVRASALGDCPRALTALLNGYEPLPPSDAMERAMHEGRIHEAHILKALRDDGWYIDGEQDEVEIGVGNTALVRCHIDGRGCRGDQRRVIEAKAFGVNSYRKWKGEGLAAFPRYQWQVSVEMLGTGLSALFVVKNRDSGEIDVAEIDTPPFSMVDIKVRVAKVMAAAKRGEMPVCEPGPYNTDWFCPFRYLHDERPPATEITSDEVVDALAAAYDKARDDVTRAEAMKAVARERLLEALGLRSKVKTSRWSVSRVVSARTVLDMPKLRAEVDLAPYELEKEVVSIRVTERG